MNSRGFQTYDFLVRFRVVRLTSTTGPNGIPGKGIKQTAATARKISKRDIANSAGTWTYYWYDSSAATWKDQTSAIHSGTTQTDFELDQNDILFIAQDYGDQYNIRHTP